MSATLTENFRYFNIQNFINGLKLETNNLYLFVSRIKSWDDENIPPNPITNYSYYSDVYDTIVSLKLLTTNNICPVIKRINWTAGTVYTMYRPDYTPGNTEYIGSGNTNNRYPAKLTVDNNNDILYDSNFYVVNDNYQVYKCLNNGAYEGNLGNPSTIEPTGTSNSPIRTSDGYTWKYMYTITASYILNFANSQYIPVPYPDSGFPENEDVKRSSVDGAVEAIIVKNGGQNYTNGTYTANIVGDGSGATVSLVVEGQKIVRATIVSRGTGYSFGKVIIPNESGNGTGAELEVIVSPKNGHGFSPWKELGARRLMISSSIRYGYDNIFPIDIGYRQVGLLLNPINYGTDSNISTGSSLSGTKSLTFTSSTIQPNTVSGNKIFQNQGTGITAYGVAVSWDNTTKTLRYYQDRFDGVDSGNNVVPFANTFSVSIPQISASGDGTNNITSPSIAKNSGDILYLDNREVVNRSPNQTEDIKIVVEF